jgi:hypothetical protein
MNKKQIKHSIININEKYCASGYSLLIKNAKLINIPTKFNIKFKVFVSICFKLEK